MTERTINRIGYMTRYLETTGERIETKVRRVLNKEEKITDSADIIYQARNEGVNPAYDIRTDKWDIAIAAMDAAHNGYEQQKAAKIAADLREKNPKVENGDAASQSTTE